MWARAFLEPDCLNADRDEYTELLSERPLGGQWALAYFQFLLTFPFSQGFTPVLAAYSLRSPFDNEGDVIVGHAHVQRVSAGCVAA